MEASMLNKHAAIILIVFLAFSSCNKKKEEERSVQQTFSNYQPSTEFTSDTHGAYFSPTDLFRDNSSFASSLFQTAIVNYKGNRTVGYSTSSHILRSGSDTLTLVVENLRGKIKYLRTEGNTIIEDTSTVSRLLFYLNGTLYFRKAFPVTLYDSVYFPTIRLFNKVYFDAAPTKTIVYFWTDEIPYGENYNSNFRRDYWAVGVDKEGVVYDLTGYFRRVSDNLDAVHFLGEDRVAASVVPDSRYRNLSIDVIINIDWMASATSLEFPSDTLFTVSGMPERYFTRTLKLYSQPASFSSFKEVRLKRATKARVLQLFAPSVLNKENITRDRLLVQFTGKNKGWVDYDTMVFEEIIAEK